MRNFFLGLVVGLVLMILVPVAVNAATSIFDIIRSNGLVVGKQGKEAKIELNGSISNTTKDKYKNGNPVTINDDLQVRGDIKIFGASLNQTLASLKSSDNTTNGDIALLNADNQTFRDLFTGQGKVNDTQSTLNEKLKDFTSTQIDINKKQVITNSENRNDITELKNDIERIRKFFNCMDLRISSYSTDPVVQGVWASCNINLIGL